MKSAPGNSIRQGLRRRKLPNGSIPIDLMASQTIRMFVDLWRLANYDMEEYNAVHAAHFENALRTIAPRGHGTHVDIDRAADLLSYWQQDSRYTDEGGKPLPLPVRGPEPSIESLCKRCGLDGPIQLTIRKLSRAGTIHRRGTHYVLVKGEVLHKPTAELVAHQMKTLYLLLLTFEHNRKQRTESTKLFEKCVEGPPVSPRASRSFGARNRKSALAFLKGQDADLLALAVKPGQRSVRDVVTVFRTTIPAQATDVMPSSRTRNQQGGASKSTRGALVTAKS